MSDGRIAELALVEVASGVSARTLKGFCTITVRDKDGRAVALGQLDPSEVRGMALQWIEVAEAADSDAAVYHELVDGAGLDPDAALMFVGALRKRREES